MCPIIAWDKPILIIEIVIWYSNLIGHILFLSATIFKSWIEQILSLPKSNFDKNRENETQICSCGQCKFLQLFWR